MIGQTNRWDLIAECSRAVTAAKADPAERAEVARLLHGAALHDSHGRPIVSGALADRAAAVGLGSPPVQLVRELPPP